MTLKLIFSFFLQIKILKIFWFKLKTFIFSKILFLKRNLFLNAKLQQLNQQKVDNLNFFVYAFYKS